ncbi:peptidoglycan D,D-transpeptidase FtsI family protein [Hoeflea prorocentri]|uniref:Penicillin-binding protein 2 n=1 Tax=Hoeflea prorocentri TaxID=1922333 RepID=A0A9X3ZG74_9HYPH|nr:penicillin-binding protein 2 [Hoeflea prorocentri]MCY6379904.1 penicillin-binding protein 2 [Hoeflea prorocentri]MDA5397704.1 penicillin-binding protein 2 [Hoeflea prorocentri]
MRRLFKRKALAARPSFSGDLSGRRASHAEGARRSSGSQTRNRITLVMIGVCMVFAIIAGRLVQYGFRDMETVASIARGNELLASRPDLLDRNGQVLATDIRTVSLYAQPHKITDPDEVIERLATVLPDVDARSVYRKLTSKSQFQWLRRQLTPKQQSDILALGIPGVGFRPEKRRFYPGGPTASHIVGHVNIDNKGIAGMEKFVDGEGLADLAAAGMTIERQLEPVRLAVDLRVQHIVRDELATAMERYQAIAAGAVVLNAKTGEVLAMSSLPDYDPNLPAQALEKDRLNRMSAGTFEMGSTFKAFTTAMALDSGLVSMEDEFDARRPIRIAGHTISDFHGKHRILSVPEIFIYSSNIGTAKMADVVGIDGQREFLTRIGLLTRMQTELPEVSRPTQPQVWKKINSITISFGHGVATTPLQTAVAAAAMLNGGNLIAPTFLPRTETEAEQVAIRVIQPETSAAMRYLMRLNVEKGSGRRAEVPGFRVGGKTGTAEKVVNGRYSSDVRFNAFLSAFPIEDPQYVVLVIIDEPKPAEGQHSATAGLNAAPTVKAIIRRSAALLGVRPAFGQGDAALLVSY